MQNTINEITRLTNFLYDYFSLDHHKDGDCHFEVAQSWDYGNEPKWQARHYGYIFDDFEKDYNTYEEALSGLLEFILISISKEKEWAYDVLENKKNYGSCQIEKAKKILNFKV